MRSFRNVLEMLQATLAGQSASRSSSEGRLLLPMFGLAAALTVLSAGMAVALLSRPIGSDLGADLCSINEVPARSVSLIIDSSERLSYAQTASVTTLIRNALEELPVGSRLEIYRVGGADDPNPAASLSLCNPGRGIDANPFIGKPSAREKLWQEQFAEVISRTLSDELSSEGGSESPIMRAIQLAAMSPTFRAVEPSERSLIVVSDLVENSREVSFQDRVPSIDQFTDTLEYEAVRADLSSVEVHVLLRPSESQGDDQRALTDFWTHYFSSMGAELTTVVPL